MKKLTKIILVLILIGVVITSYISYVHYSGKQASCPLEPSLNCNAVLNSSYSTVVGIPVAVLGLVTYLLMLIGLFIHQKNESKQNDLVLLILPAVGVIAVGFYTSIMIFRLGTICLWCEGSHLTMLILFILMARHTRPHWSYKKIFVAWIFFLIIGYSLSMFSSAPDAGDNPQVLALANCLSSKNIKMYGAYWCPHCKEQKRLFGSAFKEINYVECADPVNPRVQLNVCKKVNITSYPTWDFKGKRITGTQSPAELASFSGC